MRCPQCGCNMEKTNNCPYCDISKEQVYFASNKRAKEALKKGKKDMVCYSSVRPRDVDKVKLFLLTLFLGFLGVGNLYVGKKRRGLFCCVSMIVAFLVYLIKTLINNNGSESSFVNTCAEIVVIFSAITILLWVLDLLCLITNIYKYPVVIPDREDIEKEVDLNAR